MLTRLKRLIAGSRKRRPAARRGLHIEPLESRTLLSAASATAGLLPPPDFRQLSLALVNVGRMKPPAEASTLIPSAVVSEPGITMEPSGPFPSGVANRASSPANDPIVEVSGPSPLLPTNPRAMPSVTGGSEGGATWLPSSAERSESIAFSITPSPPAAWEPLVVQVSVSMAGGPESPPVTPGRHLPLDAVAADTTDSWTDAVPEGGYVVLENAQPFQVDHAYVASPEDVRTFTLDRALAPQEAFGAPHGELSPDGALFRAAPSKAQASQLEMLTPEATKSLSQTDSPASVGLATPSALEAVGAMAEGDTAYESGVRSAQPPATQAGAADDGSANVATMKESFSKTEAAADDALPDFTNPLASSRDSSSGDETESDYVDSTMSKPARSTRGSKADAAPDASAVSEEAAWIEPAWTDAGDAVEPREGEVADGDVADQTAARPDQSHSALESQEGGMIELAAVGFPGERAALALPQSSQRSTVLGVQEIRMDKGVGLFQAFELATAPIGGTGQRDAILSDESGNEPLARAAEPVPAADLPSADESDNSGKEQLEQSAHRPGLVPTVVVASLAAATAGFYHEEIPLRRKWRRDSR